MLTQGEVVQGRGQGKDLPRICKKNWIGFFYLSNLQLLLSSHLKCVLS